MAPLHAKYLDRNRRTDVRSIVLRAAAAAIKIQKGIILGLINNNSIFRETKMADDEVISRKKRAKLIAFTIFGQVLYYADLISDFLMALDLFMNCHYNYLIFCVSIIVVSYLTTATFLILRKLAKTPLQAFLYPIHHGKHLFQNVKKACCADTLDIDASEELYFYHITFIEATSESVLQLCLSLVIYREFGFKTWIQIASLSLSALSLYICFVKRQTYMRHGQEPKSVMMAYFQSAIYWLIPMASFFNSLTFQSFSQIFTPFAMAAFGLSIHPFVAIPVGYVMKGVMKLYAKLMCMKNVNWRTFQWKKNQDTNCCRIMCMRFASFTMVFYMIYVVFVLAVVIELILLKDVQELDFLKVKNYDDALEYNQCNANVRGVNQNEDITEKFEEYSYEVELFVLVTLAAAFLIPILESALVIMPPPIPVLDFMLGPELPNESSETLDSEMGQNDTNVIESSTTND